MRSKLYPIFLHAVLIALGIAVLVVTRENVRLRGLLAPGVSSLQAGTPAEPVDVLSLDGTPARLGGSPEDAGRLLLVFTTRCPACKQNQEAWRQLHAAVGDAIDVVGLSLDDPTATRAYRDELGLPFDVVVPADRERFASTYDIPVVPSTILIGGDGRIRGVWQGGLTAATQRVIVSGVRALDRSASVLESRDRVRIPQPS